MTDKFDYNKTLDSNTGLFTTTTTTQRSIIINTSALQLFCKAQSEGSHSSVSVCDTNRDISSLSGKSTLTWMRNNQSEGI